MQSCSLCEQSKRKFGWWLEKAPALSSECKMLDYFQESLSLPPFSANPFCSVVGTSSLPLVAGGGQDFLHGSSAWERCWSWAFDLVQLSPTVKQSIPVERVYLKENQLSKETSCNKELEMPGRKDSTAGIFSQACLPIINQPMVYSINSFILSLHDGRILH